MWSSLGSSHSLIMTCRPDYAKYPSSRVGPQRDYYVTKPHLVMPNWHGSVQFRCSETRKRYNAFILSFQFGSTLLPHLLGHSLVTSPNHSTVAHPFKSWSITNPLAHSLAPLLTHSTPPHSTPLHSTPLHSVHSLNPLTQSTHSVHSLIPLTHSVHSLIPLNFSAHPIHSTHSLHSFIHSLTHSTLLTHLTHSLTHSIRER